MGWVEKFSKGQLKIIGLLEIIGSMGIVLPMILSTLEELTVVAAAGLSLVMMGAIATHARRKEYKELKVNFFILLLLGFVITGRVILVPVL
jgi:VIT1/CCC1 family predicted Fe2+/Mn2+ transporter